MNQIEIKMNEQIIGTRFGTRTILEILEKAHRDRNARVKCDCGAEAIVALRSLIKRRSTTCMKCAIFNQTGKNSIQWKGGRHVPRTLYNRWYKSAKKREMRWDLDFDYLDDLIESQNWKCALSGAVLVFDHGQDNGVEKGNASLDRIDSKIPYLKGNVQYVTKDINMGKQQLTTEEFINLCRSVSEFWKDK